MTSLQHRTVEANGIRIHAVERGEGPAVLLVHGFPESWYSWRHQLPVLADAGYRAIAIDVRGYGRSSKPTAVDAYRMVNHVADNVGLLDALDIDTAHIVGHDWGAPIAWNSALLRPDRFRSLALLSVPYSPRSETRPLSVFEAMGGDEEFYMVYFQQPGRAEAEIEQDVRRWLLGFYFSASGDAPSGGPMGMSMAMKAAGQPLSARFSYPDAMPEWMNDDDLDFYVGEFERSGLTGGLNRYRNLDRDWEDLAAFSLRPITVPSLFVGGERDGPTIWGAGSIARFGENLPDLRGSHILPGCGHWVQQERAEDVNGLLVEFLGSLAR
ncbi:MAG: alpha/beta fold hydrolase [Acidimicrobiales bacterium]